MSIKYKDVSVELISKKDDLGEVWKISRPHLADGEIDTESVKRMGFPINGFISYSLKITSSILFRDLMLTVRPIIPWAMSNRTAKFNYDEMFLSNEISLLNYHNLDKKVEADFRTVIDNVMNGMQQDLQKVELPLLTSTIFSVQIDYRTLLNFIYTLELHITKYFEVHGIKMLEACGISLEEYRDQPKTDMYSYYSLTDEEHFIAMNRVHKQMGSIHMLGTNVYANLMAQFIRQHSAKIKNEVFNQLKYNFDQILASRSSRSINVVAYMDDTSFKSLLSTRICWFAQMDKEDKSSWSYILGPFVENMTPKEFRDALPCRGHHDKCTIVRDMIAKIQKKEVNLPCPILLQDPSLVDRRIRDYKADSILMKKWEEIKGTIDLNLDNEYLIEFTNAKDL